MVDVYQTDKPERAASETQGNDPDDGAFMIYGFTLGKDING